MKTDVTKKVATTMSYLYCDAMYRLYNVKKHDAHYLKEAENDYGKFIITGNHVNKLDGNFIAKAYRNWEDIREGKGMGAWVKEEMLDHPLVGTILKKTGIAIPINRKKGSVTKDVLKQTSRLLDEMNGVLIFMQGSTTLSEYRTPKTGPVRAAIACKAAVVPVGIFPNERVKLSEALLHKKKIHLTFGKPIYISAPRIKSYEGKKKYYRKQTEKVWSIIQDLIEKSKLSATHDT